MKVLHVVDIKNIKSNGVAAVVPSYVSGQSKYAETALLDIKNSFKDDEEYARYNGKKYKSLSELPDGFDKPDIVVFHEVYKPRYLKLYRECINKRINYIIMPHGCMTNQAQRKKMIKKYIFNRLAFFKFINKASGIHYLSNIEKQNSIKHSNSFIVGNGYNKQYDQLYTCDHDANYFVYVGRYDIYHKGLDYILDTCEQYKDWFRSNKLFVKMYGSTKKQEKRLVKIVQKRGIDDVVIINGAIYGEEKIDVICKSIAFIQTSRFEGMPQGISEALSYGVPCIVTTGTSFYEYIKTNQCGVPVSYNIESIFKAMKKMTDDISLRKVYSKYSTISSKNKYDWDCVCMECIAMYHRIAEGLKL